MKPHPFAILSSVFVCLSATVPAFARTIVVDNDFGECPQAETSSIKDAVEVRALPGDKILVCPGDYAESVKVDKRDLRIEAQAAPGEVVLQGTSAQQFGFHLLNTTGVLVQGFTVRGFVDANIRIEGDGGNTLRKNITTAATVGSGIRVINSSANVVEQNSSFANAGNGIAVSGAASSNNIIRHNETYGNTQQAGLHLETSGLGNILFGNDSYENLIGIRNVQSAHGNVIENNQVFDNVRGIMVGNSTGVTVRNNRSQRNKEFGIRLQNSAVGNLVEKNEVFENILVTPAGQVLGDGIRLESAAPPIPPGIPGPVTANIVQLNTVRKNGRDGIRVFDAAVTENMIERNVLLQNGEHDAHDESVGLHTGGTANHWINNRCGREDEPGQDENRPGLCENH